MAETHGKQRKNLAAAQEKNMHYDKTLNELESRHLRVEVRNTIAKKVQVRQTYQIAFNKRISDQLREYQLMELRHAKERFEVEMLGFEEHGSMKLKHDARISELEVRQVNERHTEKEFLRNTHETEQLQTL
jgi:hypothetical protein